MKTINGGINWFSLNYENINYKSMHFENENTGWICGSGGKIIKTTNGGLNWITQSSNITKSLNDIFFTDIQNGFIAADSGYILKTTNSGENWSSLYPYNIKNYNSVFFVNSYTGFALGKSVGGGFPPSVQLVLMKTTNGGLNWTRPLEEGVPIGGNYYDIFFLNQLTGWLAVDRYRTGYIYKTTNGGQNWFQTFGPIGLPNSYPEAIATDINQEVVTWVGRNGHVRACLTPRVNGGRG
jgi:photosystem II stability/assembly factor-like uncharacterized protein